MWNTLINKEVIKKEVAMEAGCPCHIQSPSHGAYTLKSSETSVGIVRWHFRIHIPFCACSFSRGIFSGPFPNGEYGVCPSLFSLCHVGFSVVALGHQSAHYLGEDAGMEGLALRNPTEPRACYTDSRAECQEARCYMVGWGFPNLCRLAISVGNRLTKPTSPYLAKQGVLNK